jgi:hypothetical protein
VALGRIDGKHHASRALSIRSVCCSDSMGCV